MTDLPQIDEVATGAPGETACTQIVLASGNAHKLAEFQALCAPLQIDVVGPSGWSAQGGQALLVARVHGNRAAAGAAQRGRGQLRGCTRNFAAYAR